MKKKFVGALVVGLFVVTTVALSACDLFHSHEYIETVVDPTCTEQGYHLHTCECGDNFKDNYTPELGHDFDTENVEWTWQDYSSATATFSCKRDNSHKNELTAQITDELLKEADCDEDGMAEHTATVLYGDVSYTDKETEIIPAAHDYDTQNIVWAWDGYSSATATFTCLRDQSHTNTLTAELTENMQVAPTCLEKGTKNHTAQVTLGDAAYTDTKAETVAALGHDIARHEAQAATCTDVGWDAYEDCTRCDYSTYSEISALGHDYDTEKITWTWNGFNSAQAQLTCKRDAAHKTDLTATMTFDETPATCTQGGTRDCLATVTYDGKTYTDSKIQVLASLGHNYDTQNITWTWDGYSSATATFTCLRDRTHTDTLTAEISNRVQSEPTCAGEGVRNYTAQVTFGGVAYTDTKPEPIAALGHDIRQYEAQAPTCTAVGWHAYEACTRCSYSTRQVINALDHDFFADNATWEWWNGYQSARAVLSCRRDASHLMYVSATITYEEVPATCTAAGTGKWTATISYDFRKNTDTKTQILPATGHNYDTKNVVWIWDGFTGATAELYCLNDATHKLPIPATVSSEVTTEPTCVDTGVRTYTASVSHNNNEYTNTKTDAIAALGHTEVIDNAVAASCIKTGLTAGSHCSVCNFVIEPQTEIPLVGHLYSVATWTCEVCGKSEFTEYNSYNDFSAVCTVSETNNTVTVFYNSAEPAGLNFNNFALSGSKSYIFKFGSAATEVKISSTGATYSNVRIVVDSRTTSFILVFNNIKLQNYNTVLTSQAAELNVYFYGNSCGIATTKGSTGKDGESFNFAQIGNGGKGGNGGNANTAVVCSGKINIFCGTTTSVKGGDGGNGGNGGDSDSVGASGGNGGNGGNGAKAIQADAISVTFVLGKTKSDLSIQGGSGGSGGSGGDGAFLGSDGSDGSGGSSSVATNVDIRYN